MPRVDHWLQSMVLVVSVYLKVGVVLDDENRAVMKAIGAMVARRGVPYVIGRDFNMTADVLEALKKKIGEMREIASKIDPGSLSGLREGHDNFVDEAHASIDVGIAIPESSTTRPRHADSL